MAVAIEGTEWYEEVNANNAGRGRILDSSFPFSSTFVEAGTVKQKLGKHMSIEAHKAPGAFLGFGNIDFRKGFKVQISKRVYQSNSIHYPELNNFTPEPSIYFDKHQYKEVGKLHHIDEIRNVKRRRKSTGRYCLKYPC